MKTKILNFIEDAIILLPILVILIIGCHYEATYVEKCKVISKTETTLEVENLNNHVNYKCEADATETIKVGERFYCKFTNECTESNPYDDHWIDFGKHHFLCFVW